MKTIKDLSPELRAKAVKYTKHDFGLYNGPIPEEEDILDWPLIACFKFHETEEGSDYWFDILSES